MYKGVCPEIQSEPALKTGFTIRSGPDGHMANSLYILAGLEKLPTVSPGRVDFRAGQVTFKAPHLPSGQKSWPVIIPQLNNSLKQSRLTGPGQFSKMPPGELAA